MGVVVSLSLKQTNKQEVFCLCCSVSLFIHGSVTCGAAKDAFLWKIGLTGENLPMRGGS